MTLGEMKTKVYTMIEEYDSENPTLTGDEDLANKFNTICNQIQNELTRFKKINAYKAVEVHKGDMAKLSDVDDNFYQGKIIRGVKYEIVGDFIKYLEDGTAEVYYTKTPTRITPDTTDDYEFEIPDDLLEIMPYGIAGDLLKSDVSNQYGAVYYARYQELRNSLDPRYTDSIIEIEGGVNV